MKNRISCTSLDGGTIAGLLNSGCKEFEVTRINFGFKFNGILTVSSSRSIPSLGARISRTTGPRAKGTGSKISSRSVRLRSLKLLLHVPHGSYSHVFIFIGDIA